jgi:PAS domain S-box-containing protein
MHGVRMLSSNERAHVFADVGERGDAYRVLFESNPRPQAVMDWETLAFVAVNDAACALYGWSREELLSMSAPDLRVPEERELFERFIEERRVTEPRNASTRGWHHRTKSGRVIHVDLAIVRVTFRGRAARLLDITDITNSHLAERRFRLLVEHSADGMAILDEERVVQYVSPAVEDILGLRPDEIVGRCATFLTHPGDRERTTPPRPGETLRRITRQRHRDGTWRWVEATSTNLTNEPAVRGYIVNFRDVTERTHAEQVLRRSEANFRILIER